MTFFVVMTGYKLLRPTIGILVLDISNLFGNLDLVGIVFSEFLLKLFILVLNYLISDAREIKMLNALEVNALMS